MLWSVWDNNSVVSWEFLGKSYSVDMKMSPIAVAVFPKHQLVAITGNFDVFGPENLKTYHWNGEFCRSYRAPDLGDQTQFGGARELESGAVEVLIGFYDSGVWKDKAGLLNLDTGEVDDLHRNY
jgi:hypothetical protein